MVDVSQAVTHLVHLVPAFPVIEQQFVGEAMRFGHEVAALSSPILSPLQLGVNNLLTNARIFAEGIPTPQPTGTVPAGPVNPDAWQSVKNIGGAISGGLLFLAGMFGSAVYYYNHSHFRHFGTKPK